jgi:glutathione S-transferase
MLTIYGSDLSGPAIKVRLLASYLGIDYKWQVVNLREGEQKQEWFLKINPVGKIPAMDDAGFHLFESNAMCRYLADKHNSALYPKDLQKRAVIEQWIDFITLHIGVHASTAAYSRIFAPRMNRPVNEQALVDALKFLETYFPILEKQLGAHANVVGNELSLADFVLLAVLEPVELAQINIAAYPKLIAWRKALKAQPFYTKCYKEYGEILKTPVAK